MKYPIKTLPIKILNTFLISLLAYSASAQVGIGTLSPTSPLDIETNTSTRYLDINNTAGDGDPAINFQLSGNTTFSLGLDDGDSDKFKIGTTAIGTNTRLTIDGSGNVGIGTSSPSSLMEISSGTSGNAVLTISADTDNNDEDDNPMIQFVHDGSGVGAYMSMEGNDGVTATGTLSNAFMIASGQVTESYNL